MKRSSIDPAHTDRLRRIVGLARLLDDAFRIPGTRVTFGLDSLIGLIPGVGDLVGAALSVYIIHEARRVGLPRRTLARMAWNVALDFSVGAIPVLGDIFDVTYKANRKNIVLLDKHLNRHERR